jgi:hypothetical protein
MMGVLMAIFRTRGLVVLAVLTVTAVSAGAWAGRNGSIISERSDLEVVFGSYHCGMGQGSGFAWAFLQSTGDLVPEDFFVQRNIRSADEPQEFCVGLASHARQVVQDAGCRVGPDETMIDETGASVDFSFVCHDQRSRLTKFLADLGSSVLVAIP